MEQIPKIIHESWHPYLQVLFDDPKMLLIKNEILPKCKFYPPADLIFRVFQMPLDKVRVVILGQDPYPKEGQANGLAFAVNLGITMPASLKIIRNEVNTASDRLSFFSRTPVDENLRANIEAKDEWRTLEHWWKQGVMLLNSALTVEANNADSHIGYWKWWTKEVIKIVSLNAPLKPIWMMWGAKAKANIGYIHNYYKWHGEWKGEYNYVLEADHPAAETYPGSKYKFTGCNHFNICNQILNHKHQPAINW